MLDCEIDSRLRIKSVTLEDANELFELVDANRSRLREWLGWLDKTRELKDTIGFINFASETEQTNGAVTAAVRYQDKLVGLVSFHKIDWSTSTANVGYWIGEDASGKGIVTRSVEKLVEYGFNTLNLETIKIRCASENYRSLAVPKRLGFSFDETVKNAEWLYDHHVDHLVFSMSKSAWNERERAD